MQRLPRVTSWSSGLVTFTIALSCTCSSRLQPTPQYGQIVCVTACSSSLPLPRLAQLVLAAEHQRAGRADRDAVAAVDAGRLGQLDDELGRDARVEAAARDRDRERVLVLLAAGVDALVTEDALRVVAHVQLVVDLDRAVHGGGRLAVGLDVVAGALAVALGVGRRRRAEALGLRVVARE